MGIVDKIFGNSNSDANSGFGWNILTTNEEVDDILATSNENPQVIFKHSSRCGTSFFARTSLETFSEADKSSADFHLVDVIQHRSVSAYIADKLNIRHESPQLFIIKDGAVEWHGSHHQVQVEKLHKYLKP